MYGNDDMLNSKELAETIRGCRRGDRYAQNQLYNAFYAWAWKLCVRYTRNKSETQECVQDGFFKVFTKIDRYSDGLSFEAWFKKIFIHTCIDRYRSQLNEPLLIDLADTDTYETAVAEALINADTEHLLHLVRQLPPVYQATFNLYAIEGYEYQEIAEILGVNIGSVKSNLSKARAKLREMLTIEKQKNFYER